LTTAPTSSHNCTANWTMFGWPSWSSGRRSSTNPVVSTSKNRITALIFYIGARPGAAVFVYGSPITLRPGASNRVPITGFVEDCVLLAPFDAAQVDGGFEFAEAVLNMVDAQSEVCDWQDIGGISVRSHNDYVLRPN